MQTVFPKFVLLQISDCNYYCVMAECPMDCYFTSFQLFRLPKSRTGIRIIYNYSLL